MDTPSGAAVNNFKPPGRKLWNRENLQHGKVKNSKKDDGRDNVRSSQFVNFADVPETDDDSFFDNHKIIVSTPIEFGKPGCSTHSYYKNTLIESLEDSPISMIVPPAEEWEPDEDHSAFEHQITVIQMDTNEPKHCTKATEKPNIPTTMVQCHDQDEGKPKPTLIKKKLEEGKHQFRAKPVPKYLITRKMELNKNKTEKMDSGVVGKKHKREDLEAKREQEEKEIALLRKQAVHKAQPVRKYKPGLPTINKRPLTVPQTPLVLKRRHIESNK